MCAAAAVAVTSLSLSHARHVTIFSYLYMMYACVYVRAWRVYARACANERDSVAAMAAAAAAAEKLRRRRHRVSNKAAPR